MLENRSFDHMLGLSQMRGLDAATGQPTGIEGLAGTESNRLPSGLEVAAGEGADYVMGTDPGPEFADVLEQLCGTAASYLPSSPYPPMNNSGFATSFTRKAPGLDPATIMKCFRPDQVPVLHALATTFGVCDHWFSSLPGPTWPNRLFVHAASSSGLDDSPKGIEHVGAVLEGYKFQNGTIYDRLSAAGRSWHIVEGDELPQSLTVAGLINSALQGHFLSMEELARTLAGSDFKDQYVFLEPNYGHVLYDGSNLSAVTRSIRSMT
jgi:phospholipase C